MSDGKFHVSLIMAKGRVASLKTSTIPRLELQDAVLATKLADIISKEHELQIERRIFWSDSKTVLFWIKKDPREFKVFVANLLGDIRESTKISEWRWISSRENPADDATRFVPEALKKIVDGC